MYLFYFMCMDVWPACYACVHHLCAWCMWRPEEGIGAPGTGVTGAACKPPCGCWELSPGFLQEQQVLLTTKPAPQPPCQIFFR